MRIKGQSGLDLLLGLLVLLIVLNVFSSVLTRFEDVQKEISIRSQLRENLLQVHWLTSYAGSHFYQAVDYPATSSQPRGSQLTLRTNEFARSTGVTILEKVRAVTTQPEMNCTFEWDINDFINFHSAIRGFDSGLPYDVDVNSTSVIPKLYDVNHLFTSTGCFDQFSIEALP